MVPWMKPSIVFSFRSHLDTVSEPTTFLCCHFDYAYNIYSTEPPTGLGSFPLSTSPRESRDFLSAKTFVLSSYPLACALVYYYCFTLSNFLSDIYLAKPNLISVLRFLILWTCVSDWIYIAHTTLFWILATIERFRMYNIYLIQRWSFYIWHSFFY